MKKRKEDISVYVYKVVLMLWIIMFHYSDHGAIDMLVEPLNVQWIALAIGRIGGGVGNCGFAMMSGYLLWEKQFKLERIIKLYLEVWIYSVVLGGIFCIISEQVVTGKEMIKFIFPVTFSEYWYMSSYLILYFIFPYINIFLNVLEQKQQGALILFGIFFFSVVPTFTQSNWAVGTNNIPIMIICYIIGVYIKRYKVYGFSNKWYNVTLFAVCVSGILLSEIILKVKGYNPTYFIWPMYKLPVIILAVILFWIIKPIKIQQIGVYKIIKILANSVFGVYIIHIGRMNEIFFMRWFNNEEAYINNYLMYIC